jgi:hypothetical protein
MVSREVLVEVCPPHSAMQRLGLGKSSLGEAVEMGIEPTMIGI